MLVELFCDHRREQLKLKRTSEEIGLTHGVAFGRGHLVLYVAKDCFGDFI